jgi:RNA chaperone Hfq
MQARTSVGRDFQDNLLGRLMDTNQVTTIYLRNRMSLRGRIMRFDPYVVLLDPLDGTPPQMVYKSAVVSISGPRPRPGGFGRRPGGPGGPRPHHAGPRDGERRFPPPGRPADGGPPPRHE